MYECTQLNWNWVQIESDVGWPEGVAAFSGCETNGCFPALSRIAS